MNVYDPLYGAIQLSTISSELCVLPEVRRLSQIRLLNSISPSLATLSELRRYAHTLGVLHLFNIWKKSKGQNYSREEVDALEVSIILHDVATPPFGHLFEYVLKEANGWDHEDAAVSTLLKSYGPTSIAQPIYVGRTPKVLDKIERMGVNIELVKAILSKKHALSGLIMGVVDFDNLDNVWRMAWALGLPSNRLHPVMLAQSIDVDKTGRLLLSQESEVLLSEWANQRRRVYEILVFDQPTVASQTLLTYCILEGLRRKLISSDDWFLTDESLLEKLSTDSHLREVVENQYLGVLPTPVLTLQIAWKNTEFFELSRRELEEKIRKRLQGLSNDHWWVYVFKEKGSFEKSIEYNVDKVICTFGKLSRSLIISVFSERVLTGARQRAAGKAIMELFFDNGVDANDFMKVIDSGTSEASEGDQLVI